MFWITQTPIDLGGAAAPVFTLHPSNTTVVEGNQVTLRSYATGYPGYQWRKNGAIIPGATSRDYTFTALLADDGSIYDCVATNDLGADTSDTATLTVTEYTLVTVDTTLITADSSLVTADNG